jgi:hypothetical protein
MKLPFTKTHLDKQQKGHGNMVFRASAGQGRGSRCKEAQFNNAKNRVRKPGSNESLLSSAAGRDLGWRSGMVFGRTVANVGRVSAVLSALLSFLNCQAAGAEKATNRTEKPSAPVSLEYPAFKLIVDRNIFNPNRRAGVPDEVTRVEPPKPVKIEAFSLVGTAIDERGPVAMFEGTDSKYQVVLKPEGIIGGHRITKIALNCVNLEANGAELELPVATMQMRKAGEAEWQLVSGSAVSEGRTSDSGFRSRDSGSGRDSGNRSRDFGNRGRDAGNTGRDFGGNRNRSTGNSNREFRSSSAVTAAPAATDPAVTAEEQPASSGSADDVLKKLMEKREQELKK